MESSNKPKFYSITQAARACHTYYNRIMNAIAKKHLHLYQTDPDLIEETELQRFAKEFGFKFSKD